MNFVRKINITWDNIEREVWFSQMYSQQRIRLRYSACSELDSLRW